MYRLAFLLLTLSCIAASADRHGDGPPNLCHIYYPNIPGEVLLENDKLVVQRFTIATGEWEGIHRHPHEQLDIHINGGEWTVKYVDDATTRVSATGGLGWSEPATQRGAMHESGNTGDEPIDLLWVTLKPGCMAPAE